MHDQKRVSKTKVSKQENISLSHNTSCGPWIPESEKQCSDWKREATRRSETNAKHRAMNAAGSFFRGNRSNMLCRNRVPGSLSKSHIRIVRSVASFVLKLEYLTAMNVAILHGAKEGVWHCQSANVSCFVVARACPSSHAFRSTFATYKKSLRNTFFRRIRFAKGS